MVGVLTDGLDHFLRLARSRTRLIQAPTASPALAAASLYAAFLRLERRISSLSSSGSSIGGLPLFSAFMALFYVRTKDLTSGFCRHILSVQ